MSCVLAEARVVIDLDTLCPSRAHSIGGLMHSPFVADEDVAREVLAVGELTGVWLW